MDNISDRIRTIVSRHLDVAPEKVTDRARFMEDLGADSLDTIELMMAFEDEFGCEIPDEIAETIVTVGDARAFLEGTAKT
jgi:acyl carrier protein